MNKVDIKDRIKEALEKRELTQSELAEKANIDKGQLSSYISGKYKPRQNNIDALSVALNVSEAWLMGFDVPMERKAFEQQWDKESQQLEDKISAFYHQLKGLGWSYEWLDTEKMYLLSNETTSIKITAEEYGKLVDESEEFCRKQLQKLLLKSSSLLLNAAHERTDIEVTEEMKKHDDDIMNDDYEWE